MNELDGISKIDRKSLNENNYLFSLLSKAKEFNIINEEDINNIQIQILELLYKVLERYNGVENNSVRKEVMENIGLSNIYTINVYLKCIKSPENALKEIRQNGIIDIYEKGKNKINIKVKACIMMYNIILKDNINIDNDIYNTTIKEGIKAFFKIYDPEYNAHDIKITADYPIYNNLVGKLEGIEFIEEYLKSIYLENSFLKIFKEEDIKQLLYEYSYYYKDLVINIFEIILLELFGCKLANESLYNLVIYDYEINYIYKLFEKLTNEETDILLNKTYKQIKGDMFKDDIQLSKYIEKNLSNVKFLIKNAFKNNTLDKIFITKKKINI